MLDVFELRGVARRQDAAFEAELAGFFDPRFGLRDAADFSGQADFAEENCFGIEDVFPAARSDGGDDAEIDRRLVDVNAAGDVDEDILIEELGAELFFQAPRRAARRGCDRRRWSCGAARPETTG